jgi:hypothetical protein
MVKAFGYAGYVVAAAVIVMLAVFLVRRYRAQSARGNRDGLSAGDATQHEEIPVDTPGPS